MNVSDQLVILPILIPMTGAMIALILRRRLRIQAGLALVIMIFSLAISSLLLFDVWQTGQPLVFVSGGWPAPFGITLVGDLLSLMFVMMTQLVVVTGIIYAMGSKDTVVRYPTFYPLFLTLVTGLSGAFLTGDIFNMYVFAELLVISGTRLPLQGLSDFLFYQIFTP